MTYHKLFCRNSKVPGSSVNTYRFSLINRLVAARYVSKAICSLPSSSSIEQESMYIRTAASESSSSIALYALQERNSLSVKHYRQSSGCPWNEMSPLFKSCLREWFYGFISKFSDDDDVSEVSDLGNTYRNPDPASTRQTKGTLSVALESIDKGRVRLPTWHLWQVHLLQVVAFHNTCTARTPFCTSPSLHPSPPTP